MRKGVRTHPSVATWFEGVPAEQLYLSVLTLGEIRRGIEIVGRSDRMQAGALDKWRRLVVAAYSDRILPVSDAVAEEWGRIQARRSVSVVDSLLAATAVTHGLTLVTRNVRDFEGTQAVLFNPFGLGRSPKV